ncbi:rhodanese-like domain-containing protein [Mycobacterium sp. CVI_P3]|uniref:Rhodanese-like domain-containing protein n=1 Tax=Mycobacterium pinniadriaticum TaxID=2994102 RepID=A0ABT3SHS5_9MYCO|nr:rhodanese-like domain-containing protein [Mycobacterium pinniadriaticum]MCX2932548.1 rhodanese-like domain-containing protein [Mycobacterium pinniadriaticum]MCX2939008.1 rhodanese-like domain-containing protein [Mycobacterium pinniadriaticum]
MTTDMMATPEDIDAAAAVRLANESGAVLLDVREDDEWSAGHAPGAIHIRLGELDPARLGKAQPVVAICRSGNRSRTAAVKLAAAGLTVYNLGGGMKAWHGGGRPVVREDGTAGTVI